MEKIRELAIEILEDIAELLQKKKLAKETIFDCKNGNSNWYDFEDMIVETLKRYKAKKKITSYSKEDMKTDIEWLRGYGISETEAKTFIEFIIKKSKKVGK